MIPLRTEKVYMGTLELVNGTTPERQGKIRVATQDIGASCCRVASMGSMYSSVRGGGKAICDSTSIDEGSL